MSRCIALQTPKVVREEYRIISRSASRSGRSLHLKHSFGLNRRIQTQSW